MKVPGVIALVLVSVTAVSTAVTTTPAPLRCRRCIGATSLDDCTVSVPCSKGEICYMDEMVTEHRTIEYNGGCRPRDVCIRGSPVGKRAGYFTACSKCCEEKGNTQECNIHLCGLKSARSPSLHQCYHCASDASGGAGVTDPNKCTTLATCQPDQLCGSETFRLSTKETYEFKCLHKSLCTLLTQEALKELKRCDENPGSIQCRDLAAGKRQTGYKTCTACCGDSQCNSEDCESMKERLYILWKGGVLDFATLTQNGTTPTTTTVPTGHTTAG